MFEVQQWQNLGWVEGFWARDDAGEFESIEEAAAWARREAGGLYGDAGEFETNEAAAAWARGEAGRRYGVAVRGLRVTHAGTDDVAWGGRDDP